MLLIIIGHNYNLVCFSWLKGLGLSAYTDNFHNQSIYYMYQIQGFGLEVSYVGFGKLCGVC